MRTTILAPFLALSLIMTTISGCSPSNKHIAVMWTNQSEFASYVELFNASQNRHRIVVEYKENPAGELISSKKGPDLVVGPWLKGEKARSRLIPTDYLFTELRLNSRHFYSALLDLGNIRGRQYLLPVSFNLPSLIFSTENRQLIENDFFLSLDQVQRLSRTFNAQTGGVYAKMGFSPRWNSEFLYLTARMFNARFEEGDSLVSWNKTGLTEATAYIQEWTKMNGSAQAEADFQFKYLYDPPYRIVTGGRSLFAYIPSDELLILPQDKLANIDFRWIVRDNTTPVRDDIIYMGICRNATGLDAAEAFIIWFYHEENQRRLLERSRSMGTMNHSFGISGGFSAIRAVNERTYPRFYPALLGHLPPPDSLGIPRILPNNWKTLKSEIIIPALEEAVLPQSPATKADTILSDRLALWKKAQ